ncbi:TPA: single-stranded DNA-binding protein, partial [Streptococcus agalactiae]
YVTEVVAENFQLLESRNSQQQTNQSGYSSNSYFGNANKMDISDDDLPF